MAQLVTNATGALKMEVGINARGKIAQEGETVTGTKSISVPGLSSDCTLEQADAVFEAIIGNIAGGEYDTITAEQTLTRKVVE